MAGALCGHPRLDGLFDDISTSASTNPRAKAKRIHGETSARRASTKTGRLFDQTIEAAAKTISGATSTIQNTVQTTSPTVQIIRRAVQIIHTTTVGIIHIGTITVHATAKASGEELLDGPR